VDLFFLPIDANPFDGGDLASAIWMYRGDPLSEPGSRESAPLKMEAVAGAHGAAVSAVETGQRASSSAVMAKSAPISIHAARGLAGPGRAGRGGSQLGPSPEGF